MVMSKCSKVAAIRARHRLVIVGDINKTKKCLLGLNKTEVTLSGTAKYSNLSPESDISAIREYFEKLIIKISHYVESAQKSGVPAKIRIIEQAKN